MNESPSAYIIVTLSQGQPSMGLFTAEGGQFLGGHGVTAETKLRTFAGLSELWDSGTSQRIRAKEFTTISGSRLSVSLAAQRSVAALLMADPLARDQGITARFLVMMQVRT